MATAETRAAKQSVLSKVNQVLVNAGLNDTVWSIRDCDSTLFVLMYKKLVGKVRRGAKCRMNARANGRGPRLQNGAQRPRHRPSPQRSTRSRAHFVSRAPRLVG